MLVRKKYGRVVTRPYFISLHIKQEVDDIAIFHHIFFTFAADKSLGLELTDRAKAFVIEKGFDPLYGARPLRRYLQSSVETLIARSILSGDVAPGSTLVVDAENGELVCRSE